MNVDDKNDDDEDGQSQNVGTKTALLELVLFLKLGTNTPNLQTLPHINLNRHSSPTAYPCTGTLIVVHVEWRWEVH